jgi:recombinational DNA repair protein (RecF pathway)
MTMSVQECTECGELTERYYTRSYEPSVYCEPCWEMERWIEWLQILVDMEGWK